MTTEVRLKIIGQGAVSPAGCQASTLWDCTPLAATAEGILSDPNCLVPVRRVKLQQAKLARWELEPRLRRASPLAYFLLEAAHQALEGASEIKRERIGQVCALGTGSIVFSRQFYTEALQKGRRFASPKLFPETVYNSPVSHLASVLNISGACYTIMGDETAWIEALRVAHIWMARKTVDAVLVVAGEELDAIALEAYHGSGWCKRGLVATEGAGAILVTRPDQETQGTVHLDRNTITFRSRSELKVAWEKCMAEPAPNQSLVLPANFVPLGMMERLPQLQALNKLGPDWGFAFTASAAWTFLQALEYRKKHPPFTLLVPGANTAVGRVSFG